MEIEFSLSFPPSRLLLTVCQGSGQPAGHRGQGSVPVRLVLKALAWAGGDCIPGALASQDSPISGGLRGTSGPDDGPGHRSHQEPVVAGQRWGLPGGWVPGVGPT